MDALPFEIVALIVQFTDYETRCRLLTVSRGFQELVEKDLNWTRYRCRTNSNIEEFLAHYHGHRCRYLREISVHVDFPYLVENIDNPLKCRETAEELQDHNERFTRQISGLFNALKTLEERELPGDRPSGICLYIENPRQFDDKKKFCHHRRYHSWRLQLLNAGKLPTLSSVRELAISKPHPQDYSSGTTGNDVRPLDFGILPALISKMPNLDNLDCPFLSERFPEAYEYAVISHFNRPWEGPWRDTRHAFGNLMLNEANLPRTIQHVKLMFGVSGRYMDLADERRALPDLVKPASYDVFSSALRVLSQHAASFEICACVDSTVFWPAPEDIRAKEPLSWPYLKQLCVQFRPFSPSGTWYFQDPRGEGQASTGFEVTTSHYPPLEENEEDENWDEVWNWEGGRWENFRPDMFRIMPRDEIIEPFLKAFAKALENMPLVESADLFTFLAYDPREERWDHEAQYYTWGLRCNFPKNGASPIMEWRVGDWRPSEKLRQRFRHLGDDRGAPLEERWLDWRLLD